MLGGWGSKSRPGADTDARRGQVAVKQAVNPFFNTGLLTCLLQRKIGHLVTNSAVEASVRVADDAGITTTVLEDRCAAGNMDLHRFAMDKILPIFCTVSTAAAFISGLKG